MYGNPACMWMHKKFEERKKIEVYKTIWAKDEVIHFGSFKG